ncbi:HD domain-containing protein [Rhodopila sp.]|jgi:uncharacterized protein|uniref:HD domain-containing protein n=1 Tax=Rhodopila sp. TaxID=2480087 RepID=UPI002B83E253|nr:HD domain-containing protein [Rhodopila sp.]HVZ06980.1 HD domain-containing protein [Rhodopila sp.]
MRTDPFGDQADLAAYLLAELGPDGTDGSHDRSHLLRVWQNARRIAAEEPGCQRDVLVAAVLLHDCVAVEKNSPDRPKASRLAAARARGILAGLGWPAERIRQAAHAIEAHSFSAGIEPRTMEARILQDADRLEAIGAIGIARCFYVAGRMGSALYSPNDPAAVTRALDDRHFALDHFGAKLFTVAEGFRTVCGRRLAAERAALVRTFHAAFLAEIGDGNTA